MRQTLFPNIKKMTTLFCIAIVFVTFTALTMRLTVLSGMAVALPVGTIQSQSDSVSGQAGLTYQINPSVYFSSSDAKGNIFIKNLETNSEYIRVDLKLNDTGRSIYYSGDLKPGTSVDSVRLQGDPLSNGIYKCTATITAYSMDAKDKLGSSDVPVTVYVGVKPDK